MLLPRDNTASSPRCSMRTQPNGDGADGVGMLQGAWRGRQNAAAALDVAANSFTGVLSGEPKLTWAGLRRARGAGGRTQRRRWTWRPTSSRACCLEEPSLT